MATVVFQGTRIDDAETLTYWDNWTATATIEPDYYYQGSNCISCQVKTSQTGMEIGDANPLPTGLDVDITTDPGVAYLFKVIQTNYTAIDQDGLILYIGNGETVYYAYNIFNSSTYPPTGGFQIVPIDPIVSGLRNSALNSGSPTDTAIDWYGIRSDANAQAKAPNLGIDALDWINIGEGLLVDGTGGSFTDFIDTDEGTSSNRWGVVTTRDGIIFVNGTLVIGSGVSQVGFSDSNRVLVFPDSRTSTNFAGIDVNLSHSSTSVVMDSCTLNGRGQHWGFDTDSTGIGNAGHTVDSRPNFTVSGVTGSATFDNCSFLNHNQVNFTSSASMNGGRIEARHLTQNSCDLSNVTIVTDAISGVATLQDPTFGSTTDLYNVDFIQVGEGWGLEIDTATSYTLNNITFTNYGATNSHKAAIYVSATTGTVTLNVAGGTSPTYYSEGADVSIVVNPYTYTINTKDSATGSIISGVRVRVEMDDGSNYPYLESGITLTGSVNTATVSHTGHGLESNDSIVMRGCEEDEYNGIFTISVSDANTFTYTTSQTITASPATGNPNYTYAIINGLTDASGNISGTKSFTADQPVVGTARKASESPYYIAGSISDTIDSTKTTNVQLVSDE